jgi:hypothetical protein
MNSLFPTPHSNVHKETPENAEELSDQIQESIEPYQHEINTADGAEFLDDGIRMKEQPFEKKEEK